MNRNRKLIKIYFKFLIKKGLYRSPSFEYGNKAGIETLASFIDRNNTNYINLHSASGIFPINQVYIEEWRIFAGKILTKFNR